MYIWLMTPYVAVVGTGSRAGGWATRFLAAGLDVVATDPAVVDLVEAYWPAADRLGLFPGASPRRLRITQDHDVIAAATFVQVVGDERPPLGAAFVADDHTAHAYEPIHLVPLVELRNTLDSAELAEFYDSIGMMPRAIDTDAHERRMLGPALIELTDGEPDALIAVMRSLRTGTHIVGTAVAHHEARRFAAGASRPWRADDVVAAPLRLYSTHVEPDWVDYNGHMTEAAYLTAAGWASDALFRYIGDDEAYRAAGHSFFTVETHIHYLLEVDAGVRISFDTHILGVDAKRVHLVHRMVRDADAATICTVEQMLVHVDMHAGRSAPILSSVAEALTAIADAHRSLTVPQQVGTVMRLSSPRA
jgi:acyl-CoA thioesterase FadM